jgi:thioredoxin-like negative regulator of GroEL
MKTVIKFYSNGCGPCRSYSPVFEKVKQDLQGIAEFIEVNVENDPENLSGKYRVRAIPHTVVLQDGEQIAVQSGRLTEEQLKNLISN